MSRGQAVVLLALLGLAALAVWLHVGRVRRMRRSWQRIASRRGWSFEPASGPWYDRREFALRVPTPPWETVISWIQGGRYTPSLTWISSEVGLPGHLVIAPRSLLTTSNVNSGDPDYDAAFDCSSTEPERLAGMLDADWRSIHRGTRVTLNLSLGTLRATTPGLVPDEEELVRFLETFIAFRDRLAAAHGVDRERPSAARSQP